MLSGYIAKFKKTRFFHKCIKSIGPLISTSVGMGVAVLAIYLLLTYDEVNKSIYSCLDSGGSYNYLECYCDYKISHPYIVDHKCN